MRSSRLVFCGLLALSACSGKKDKEAKLEPAPVSADTTGSAEPVPAAGSGSAMAGSGSAMAGSGSGSAAAGSGSAAVVAPTGPWVDKTRAFYASLAGALDASGDDCTKLTAELVKLEPQAAALATELKAGNHKIDEVPPDADVQARMEKHGDLLDRCEKKHDPKFKEALDKTLLVVAPFEIDLKGVKLDGLFAPK